MASIRGRSTKRTAAKRPTAGSKDEHVVIDERAFEQAQRDPRKRAFAEAAKRYWRKADGA